jgi:hypothetical protein
MKTYLTVTFSSEGTKPSEVVARLQSLGFKPITGSYDFVYDWDSSATIEEAIWFADKIHATLEGYHTHFQIETTSD